MRLFSQSITAAVETMLLANGQGRTLVTLPSYDGPFMLAIAQRLVAVAKAHQARLELKIAFKTLQQWRQEDVQIARDNGWEDTRGNLTYYRNTLNEQEKTLVVLCGADKVTDTAGLEDFTFCDETFIWTRQGNALFTDWLRMRFEAAGLTLPTDSGMPRVYDLLKTLRLLPSGGLLQISHWLDAMTMDDLHSGTDLLQHMLVRLDVFGLPNCRGFAGRRCRHKTFTQYAKAAQAFFDYTSFIKFQDRNKGLTAVDSALAQLEQDAPSVRVLSDHPDEICPSYTSGKDFLDGLRRYIDTEDAEEREKLYACDFVTLHDVVLRCRSPRAPKSKESPKKLYGPLLDSLLTALWETLEQGRKKNKELDFTPPLCLRLRGENYWFTNESEGRGRALTSELCQYAKEQLGHLLSGVDSLLTNYLRDENGLCVYSDLMPVNDPKVTRKAPFFSFSVEVAESPDGPTLFHAPYEWIIPEKHGDRLDAELIRRADVLLSESVPFLPVFHLPYYDELLNAPDGDDTREILRHCLRESADVSFADNLLDNGRNTAKDPLSRYLSRLAGAYAAFIHDAAQHSLLHALFQQDASGNSSWRALKQAYESALRAGKELAQQEESILSPLLMRAFLLTNQPLPEQGDNWRLSGYEDSAIVTVLHPALLEQIHARVIFLCAGFRHIYRQALGTKQGFAPRILQRYLRMARPHAPLCTLLRTPGQNLTSEVRGDDHIHKIGHVEHPRTATLSTRLHSDGDRFQEKLRDSDLYAESDESILLDGLLRQYHKLRPHAADGISLAIFRNISIQPIIAGLHSFLCHLAADMEHGLTKRTTPYDVRLIFFSKSNDAADLRVWLTQWQSRWEAARHEESQTANACYRYCHLTVAHQLVRNSREMEDLVRPHRLDVDIALLYGLLDTSKTSCSFKEIAPFDVTGAELKFPILEKKYCVSRSESQDLSRSRVISLRQFPIATLHTELLASLRRTPPSESSLVISSGSFHDWKNTIALLHDAAEWVICIDPAMDEALIRDSATNKIRDIIAFGSGVGSYGEANYTISSEQLSCQDLYAHISQRLASLYGENAPNPATCHAMAENLLHAEKLAGMGLIRAASLQDNHIHDFLAYSLTRRLLQAPDTLCDTMISLDAYLHWFPSRDTYHPDLLWITGEDRDGCLHLHARLVECKLAHADDNLVWHAHKQLRDGLTLLEPLFRPRADEMDDARPDRRYWWHQLHRVITSSMYAEQGAEARRVASLLEQLVEGQFSIEWEALLLTYWTDDDGKEPRWTDSWDIDGIPAHQCVIGCPVQIRLALQDISAQLWEEMQQQEPCPEQEDRYAEDIADSPEADPVMETSDFDEDGISGEDDDELSDWERTYLSPEVLDPRSVAAPGNGEPPRQEEKNDHSTEQSQQESTASASVTDAPVQDTADAALGASFPHQKRDDFSAASPGAHDTVTPPRKAPLPGAIPEQILLGTNKSGQPVYWRFKDAVNRHLIIFGSSGNGKTYAIQCLLAELARQSLNTMVLDYSQSFSPSEILPPVAPYFPESEQHIVVAKPLPINPLTRQKIIQLHTDEPAYLVAGRITDIFKKIFSLGTQQVNILQDAIIECLEQNPATTFQDVEHMLDTFQGDDRYNKASLESLHAHVRSFIRTNPFTAPRDNSDWQNLYGMEPACNHVFQLASIPDVLAAGIIEFVLWDLFFHAQRHGNPAHPSLIVLDEIQNLSLQSGSPVDKILREGRKFGIGLIAATQSFSGVKQSLSTLNQAAYKLYFRPADNEMAECGKQLHDVDPSCSASDWKVHLTRLKRGECYIVGPATAQERPVRFVKIASMEERGFGN